MKKLLNFNISNLFVILFWAVVIFVTASLNLSILNRLNDFAVIIMLGFLSLGLVLYILNKKRLFVHCFLCSATLCLYLKGASNTNLKLPELNEARPSIQVANINLSSAGSNYQLLLKEIQDSKPDVISLQEYNPNWNKLLTKELLHEYPYKVDHVRIDPYGMAFYSKFPIVKSDTLFSSNIPMLRSTIKLVDNTEVNLTNVLIIPSINPAMDTIQRTQITNLGNLVGDSTAYKLVMGDFNLVYWSPRIREFRNRTKLLNSRRDLSQSVFSIPVDHIFYGQEIECVGLRDMVDSLDNRIGILGTFQLNTLSLNNNSDKKNGKSYQDSSL